MLVDVTIPAGTEKTIPLEFAYSGAAELPIVRMAARTEDWTIDPSGLIQVASFGSLETSVGKWLSYGPVEFTVAPEKSQLLRFTISVPPDTKPGDYMLAVYVDDRTPPPPFEAGKKRITLKFRYYSIITIKVPGLTREPSLDNLAINRVDKNFIVTPTLSNKGNSQVDAVHSFEIRDAADRVIIEMKPEITRPVLGGHKMRPSFSIKEILPIGKYKLVYKIDFRYSLPIVVGKLDFEVTEADFLAQQKNLTNNTVNTAANEKIPNVARKTNTTSTEKDSEKNSEKSKSDVLERKSTEKNERVSILNKQNQTPR